MKAVEYVNQGKCSVESAVGSLEHAMIHAEKQCNKQVIQDAICALNNACTDLDKFED